MSDEIETQSQHLQLPLLPLRDVVVFPHMVIPLVCRPSANPSRRWKPRWRRARASCWWRRNPPPRMSPRPTNVRDRLRRQYPADAEAARRHRQGAGRGRAARPIITSGTRMPFRGRADRRWQPNRRRVPKSRRCAAPSFSQFDQYVKLNKKIPPEILTSLAGIDEAGRLADTIAAHLPLKLEQKQEILEMFDVEQAPRAPARPAGRRSSTSCRWKSASAAASSARWRRASASTT